MPIATQCNCGRKLNLKDELAGKMIKCPQCGTALKVPGEKGTATAVATPPPRSAPDESKIMAKPPAKKKDDAKAGPKVLMGNFKSLEDFDAAGNIKKKKKEWAKEEEESVSVGEGTTSGAMAKLAAEALTSEKEKPKHRCPGCGKGVKPEDVICMKCGTNVKTGKRVGEKGPPLSMGKMLGVGAVFLACGIGALVFFTKKKPEPKGADIRAMVDLERVELAAVAAMFEAGLMDPDPELDRLKLPASYLCGDALPILVKVAEKGQPSARKKAVRLLETLAWNGYRSQDSRKALVLALKDPDPEVKDWALEGLFWSACDPMKYPLYWGPKETDLQKRTDTVKMYALPFANNREALSHTVKEILRGKKFEGYRSRQSPKLDIMKEAASDLEIACQAEMDNTRKLSMLIQAIRAGRMHLIGKLIKYLQDPAKDLPYTPTAGDRQRAWRCLHDVTGRKEQRFDPWDMWWKTTGGKKWPPPKAEKPPK